ncbi:hypothetical protein [Couchioplanes caeruleus]|uniref:EXPERA domain-containing protein n=2 Tax=Couchioplanes caeruleus TaxID=56438 RepID=A0A1K0FE42_9ACTN|nr:hypothetical protein [Couchioplanes caeruleus]OJF11111.1 hypothetical protein BG844_28655 [Couchioplanes caeruleus subsp. caeruleus]ROP33748.1 hypothetical protein EDD30_6785 [Couchioplanes caeruleus]
MFLSNGARRARTLAWLAVGVVWASLLILPWWPTDYLDPYFLEYRTEAIKRYQEGGDDWWDAVPYGYYLVGFLIHLAAATATPVLAARRGWHWAAGVTLVLATVWEFTAVVPYGLLGVTVVPFLPMLAGVFIVVAWAMVRRDAKDWQAGTPEQTEAGTLAP